MAEAGQTPRKRKAPTTPDAATAPAAADEAGPGATAYPPPPEGPVQQQPEAQPPADPAPQAAAHAPAGTAQAYPAQPYPTQPYAAQAQPPTAWAGQGWQPPTYGEWEDRHGRPTPSGGVRRAFSGVTAGEYLRDAAAAALLLLSLWQPWDFGHEARGRLEVVVVTLLSLASLALPYLARGGAFAGRLDARRAGLLRVLANVPYLVMVLAFFVVDLITGDDASPEGGVGGALALGLAGVVLAMRPGDDEVGVPWLDRRWLVVPAVLGGFSAAWALGSLLAYLAGDGTDTLSAADVVATLLLVLVGPAVLVLGVVGMLRRDEGWRLATGVVAATPIALVLLGSAGGAVPPVMESVHFLASGLVLWPAVAASAWVPSARRAMRVAGRRWGDATTRVLTVAVIVAAVDLLVSVLGVAESDDTARWVVLALLSLLYAAAAVAGAVLLRSPRRGWGALGLGVAGALLVVGVVAVLVAASDDIGMVNEVDLLLAFGLPIGLAALVLAQESHDARGVAPHPALAEAPRQAPAGPPAPPAPPASDAVRMATDPATPQATLADLATRVPETRVLIARHPAAYPALLDWLAALGDPEVSRAVEQRRGTGV